MDALTAFTRALAAAFGAPVPLLRSPDEVTRALQHAPAAVLVGVDAAHSGAAFVGTSPPPQSLPVAVIEQQARPTRPTPDAFRVVAIVPTFNEADVISHTVRYLVEDGIGVYVVDNWSDDQTLELVRAFEGRGLLGWERFPSAGPSPTYDLRRLMGRVEELSTELDADWLVLHDADERRRSPWPGVGLRDALFRVQSGGFNCVDHTTLTFSPVDNLYTPDNDLEDAFAYFEFSSHAGHFHQRRAWQNLGHGASVAPTGGHDIQFDGRRVFPYRFLLKHYPIRSQAHGERKVVRERRARWNPDERALGWHAQYDEQASRSFLRDPAQLERFDASFYGRRLVERLTGVGIFEAPPAWATPPHWQASELFTHRAA